MLHRFNPLKEFSTYHHPPLSRNTCQPLHKLIPKTTTTTTTKKLSILRISILLYPYNNFASKAFLTFVALASRLLKTSSSTTLVMSKRMMPERTELRTASGKGLMLLIHNIQASEKSQVKLVSTFIHLQISDQF